MEPIEIIVIVVSVGIVVGYIASYMYKRIKNKPTGECSCCSHNMEKSFKKISKELEKECRNQNKNV